MGWRLSVERKIHDKNVAERERLLSIRQQTGILVTFNQTL